MKPKEKGDLAVAHAIFYFQTHGYEVCLPIGDKRTYDLVVEYCTILYKVQVKYAGYYASSKTHKAALRTMGGNQTYHYAKKYKDNDFDILFVYTGSNRSFVIPWDKLYNRNSISIEAGKFAQYEVK